MLVVIRGIAASADYSPSVMTCVILEHDCTCSVHRAALKI